MAGKEKCIQNFGGKTPRKGDRLDDPGGDGRVILKGGLGGGGMKYFYLAQNLDRWLAFVNAEMNFLVP